MKKTLLFTSLFLLAASQAQAATPITACKKADLNGNYKMFQNSVAAANLHIGQCEVAINNGVASGACHFTVSANGQATPAFSGPVSGVATINSNCSANIELDFNPAPSVTVQSFLNIQFTPDKQSFVGSWTNSFGLIGTTGGTRYSPALPETAAPN